MASLVHVLVDDSANDFEEVSADVVLLILE